MHYLHPAYAPESGCAPGFVVRQLEIRLAAFHQVAHCVCFCSGFWALAAAIKALVLPGRTEVILPSLTYRRMADIVAWAGLTPHFCEVDRDSLTNTAGCVAPCLNERTALILGVHPINGLADAQGLSVLAQQAGVPLLFDSVESVYEYCDGVKIGGFGAAEVFSIGASKLINGFEGGYICTSSADLAKNLREMAQIFSLHDAHAALALASLDDLDEQIERNRTRYLVYGAGLAELKGLRLLSFSPCDRPAYKNILVEVLPQWGLTRDLTVSLLNAEGALARAYYPQPLHRKLMQYPHVAGDLPATDDLADHYILLPCGELVSEADVCDIVALLEFIAKNSLNIRSLAGGRVPDA